jgi:NAD(P)-dependent dehydrogenase (short-subunit alcohol dehydrogenase family)
MTSSFKYINKLQGKNVLIVGGSSGFGFAVAEASLENGASVILASSNADKLANAAQRLQTSYPHLKAGQVQTFVLDIGKLDDLETRTTKVLEDATASGSSKIDHVVITAGGRPVIKPFAEVEINDLLAVFNDRAFAPIILAKVLTNGDYINKSNESSFTVTSGVSAYRPVPMFPLSAFLSSSISGLARALGVALAPIRSNVVTAGAVETELLASFPVELKDVFREKSILKRLGQPEEIAEAYLYLMKDASVTGTEIISDSGHLLWT